MSIGTFFALLSGNTIEPESGVNDEIDRQYRHQSEGVSGRDAVLQRVRNARATRDHVADFSCVRFAAAQTSSSGMKGGGEKSLPGEM